MDWSWEVAFEVLPQLARGLIVTVEATFVGAFIAYLVGLIIAIIRMSKSKIIGFSVYWVSEFIRRTPLLVQLYFLFYVLPDLGIFLTPFFAGVGSGPANGVNDWGRKKKKKVPSKVKKEMIKTLQDAMKSKYKNSEEVDTLVRNGLRLSNVLSWVKRL